MSVIYKRLPLTGFSGYKVGSDGTIWSCWIKFSRGRGHGSGRRLSDNWRQIIPPKGRYPRISLRSITGVEKSFKVARLVLETFVGPCPIGMEACHFPDRDPWNSSLSNLRWDTKEANWADRKAHGNGIEGKNNPKAKLTEEGVARVRELRTLGYSYRRIAQIVGLKSKSTVMAICSGKTWATLTTKETNHELDTNQSTENS